MPEGFWFSLIVIAIVAALAGIGALWNHVLWVRDGRPSFTSAEQLRIDVLRAQGRTLSAARRTILAHRGSPFVAEIEAVRDTGDLINNPGREAELRDLLRP